MAIKIPILTSFDPKGLKQANAAFAGLQTSLGSLGRNFAIVGAGITGATALLSKAVMSASNFEAEFEGVNQIFKEAASSVQAFAETAAQTAGLSATEALRAAKTFGSFATNAGLGVEEAAKFSTTLVQLAGDLGSFNDLPTADALAAIQSGLQGQADPLKKFSVFLDDLTLKQALFNATGQRVTGTLTTQQKMVAAYTAILEQTTVQQGDFVKYQDTLGNQLKIVSEEFANLTRDIGMILIPVITEAMPVIREMSAEIGEKLKAAVGSIDWKSLIKSVVDFTAFLVTNAETIAKLVAAVFLLNTAFKLMAVASGVVTVALKIQEWWIAKVATGTTVATVATNLLSQAMRLVPFVGVVTGLIYMVDSFNKTKTALETLNPEMDALTTNTLAVSSSTSILTPYLKIWWEIAKAALAAAGAIKSVPIPTQAETDRLEIYNLKKLISSNKATTISTPALPDFSNLLSALTGGGSGSQQLTDAMDELNKAQEEAARKEQEILDKRKSAFESFNDSVKSLFGQIKDSILSSFDLPSLGNSVNSITRNIGKLLEKTKSFASNISQLSGMGLNSNLLQQVIQAGPIAGSKLASAIVGGGAGFISQLNSAYNEFGGLASGIAGTGTNAAFKGQQTVNNYSIEVTGGLATGSDVGRAVVNAIKDYERQSGAAWRA